MAEPKGPLATPPKEPPKVAADKASAVVDEVRRAPTAEKKRIAVDQRLLMNEVNLLLADKRTSYALLRTGVTVAIVPLSLWTFLIATSKLWNPFDLIWFLIPFALVTLSLFGLGAYLILHALGHLRHTEAVLTGIRQSDTMIGELLLDHSSARFLVGRWYRSHRH